MKEGVKILADRVVDTVELTEGELDSVIDYFIEGFFAIKDEVLPKGDSVNI